MKTYLIRCLSPGQTVLAQKILFEKGITWRMQNTVRKFENPVVLIARGERLTFLHDVEDDVLINIFDDEDPQMINFSELLRL